MAQVTSAPAVETVVPLNWGRDGLSAYLHAAHRNRLATFVNKPELFDRLSKIDWCFAHLVEGWLNPPDLISPLLFLRAHSAYRAACENAMAGQAGELYAQQRACLERVGYGLLIGKTPGLGEIWLRRHEDRASKDASIKAFTPAAIRKCLTQFDKAGAERFDSFYQLAIDLGAHPNEQAITGNLTIKDTEGRREYQQIFMHGDGLALEHALITTARVGVCALETSQNLYSARYELLGIRAVILELRRHL
jgi:hypothetical protein